MIDVTGIDLVEFAKKVYELSVSQGMGILHYIPTPLTDDEARQLVDKNGDFPLDMDYIKGRACKMVVHKTNGKLEICDTWYDHTDRIYQQLLNHFDIRVSSEEGHGCACNCMDCQHKQSQA